MRTNTTKAKLADGKVLFGAIIGHHAPDLVELFGAIGYDFVMIDCEHGPMSRPPRWSSQAQRNPSPHAPDGARSRLAPSSKGSQLASNSGVL